VESADFRNVKALRVGLDWRSRYSDWLRAGKEESKFESRQIQEPSLHQVLQTGFGAHPAPYAMVLGTLSPALRRPERETDHSPLTSAEV
jgi:hypothetical protein